MLYDIEIRYFNSKLNTTESRTVQDYHLVGAIEQIKLDCSFAIYVISANFVFEETLINNLKS